MEAKQKIITPIKRLEKIYDVLSRFGGDTTKISDKGYRAFYPYSGRFMYGAYCVGVTVDRDSFSEVCKAFKKKSIDYRTDSMGLSTVFYFADLEFNDVVSLCCDDED